MKKYRKPTFPQEIFNPERNLQRIREMSGADRHKAVEKYKEMFGDTRLPAVSLASGLVPAAEYKARLS